MRIGKRPLAFPSKLALALVSLVAVLAAQQSIGHTSIAAAQTAPVVIISPTSAAPGEKITLQGSGWPANASLVARMYEDSNLDGPGSDLGGAFQSDASGSFSVQGTVPNSLFGQGSRGTQNVVPGSYTIVVSAGPAVSATVPFTVGAPAQGGLLWGQVYIDANNSGMIDAGDTSSGGLTGVSITGPTPDSPTRQAITDAKGRYILFPVESGSYTMTVKTQRFSMDWSGTAEASVQSGQAVRADILLRQAPVDIAPERYFPETGFAIQNDAFWDYFSHRGGVRALGFPISRTFTFLGYPTQFFQRIVLQEVPGQGIQRLNLLDPGLMPYTGINGSQFPAVDPSVKAATPAIDDPNYDSDVIEFIRQHAPNQIDGKRVGFFDAFDGTVTAKDAFPEGGHEELVPLLNLEIWGTPISDPTVDPNNSNFIYLRFQRGILHFQGYDSAGNPITEGILLGDWFKSLITGGNLPADLEQEAKADNSPFLRQYDPTKPGWMADPARLPGTDLTFAFERQLR